MAFHARHGCLDWEKAHEQEFEVDFSADYPLAAASASDNLADALDYAGVYSIVAEQMQTPCELLEHLAGRIARAISQSFPSLKAFTLTVAKLNPPVGGPCGRAQVVFHFPEDLG